MGDTIHCDLVVLGGGPGGYTAAFRAADLGLSVCLVERRKNLGGVCLNEGCIPSKTLLHGTSILETVAGATDYGVSCSNLHIDTTKLREKKDDVITRLAAGLDKLSKARKITRLIGKGNFLDRQTLLVDNNSLEISVHFTYAIIATGSSPFSLPGLPEDSRIWDSTDALSLKTIPKRLLILGGGVIGMEMAQVYHALGSQITVVEMLDHIIPSADKDIIQSLFLKCKKKYQILTKTRVASLSPDPSCIRATFEGVKAPADGEYDAVLVAVGRRANTEGIGLENTGITLTKKGFIETNKFMQTTTPHFYAVGDAAGEPMLAHKATHEAKTAAENISGHSAIFQPKTIPSVAYTNPEIAWAGLTEKEAKAQNIPFSKGKFPWGASGRALSTGASTGVSKVLFDKKNGVILGAGICGSHAGELIHEAVLALEKGATASEIAGTVHAHPTLSETFAFAAECVDGSCTDTMPPRKR